jgi:hypothetical protein
MAFALDSSSARLRGLVNRTDADAGGAGRHERHVGGVRESSLPPTTVPRMHWCIYYLYATRGARLLNHYER